MATFSRKAKRAKRAKKASDVPKDSGSWSNKASAERGHSISPMTPRQYSAKEREEIRRKELEILKSATQ